MPIPLLLCLWWAIFLASVIVMVRTFCLIPPTVTVFMLILTAFSTEYGLHLYDNIMYNYVIGWFHILGWNFWCSWSCSLPLDSKHDPWTGTYVCTSNHWCAYLPSHIMQGVTGYEGAFRKSCEATMKVLRQDSDALIWYNNISWNFCPLNIFSMTYIEHSWVE